MLKQAMTLPTGTAVAGRDVTLLDVLGNITDRSRRLEITHAYWRLVKLLGEYRFCWEESQRIQSIGLGRIDANLLEAAQQAADRELAAVELAVLNAQYNLAEVAALDLSGQLPLPVDRPHTGTYNTFFEQIFADSAPPGQTRLLHRTLPLQQQVIGVRVEAVHAAQDALDAVAQSYQAGQVDAADLLAALHEITLQQRAWMTAVVRYNHSIADYALAIAGPETAGRKLVSILIKLSQAETPIPPGTSDDSSTGSQPDQPQQASAAPFQAATPAGDGTTVPGEPTLAPSRDTAAEISDSQGVPPVPLDPVEKNEPAVEPAAVDIPVLVGAEPAPDPAVTPAIAESPVEDAASDDRMNDAKPELVEQPAAHHPSAPEESVAKEEEDAPSPIAAPESEKVASEQNVTASDLPPPAESAKSGASPPATTEPAETQPHRSNLVVQSHPMVAVEESDTVSKVQTVFRQPGPTSSDRLEKLHGDLIGLPAGIQAKRLTGVFHDPHRMVATKTEAIDLETCLDGVPGSERHAVLEAYWEASHRLAEYEVYRRQTEILDTLVESVTLGAAGTTDAMARLKAAQFDAKADVLDAGSRLLAAEYELTKRCSRPLDGSWLVPKTPPHAGDYRLNLESQPAQIVESWTLKRLATLIPTLNRSLKDRAVAVVEADSRRADAVYAYETRSVRFDRVLAAVEQQTQEYIEFLNVLAAYNQSIAEYVTAVVPEALPEEQLVATLVVR